MIKKILRNETGADLQIINRVIANTESYDIAPHFWTELAIDDTIHALVLSEDVIVNDGIIDLSPAAGLLHIDGVLESAHEPVDFLSLVGEKAPSVIPLNGASYGYNFQINDELYTFTHLESPVASEEIQIQLHLCIDNAIADRWIQFELTVLTTTGNGDKQMNTHDAVINTVQIEVPTTPFLIFEVKTIIPANLFQNGEDNLFTKIRRITATGKTAPTNHPSIVRVDKIYKRERLT